MSVSEWVFGWWLRIAWWTPEGRAFRQMRRYGQRVVRTVAHLSQAPASEVEEAVQEAFLALYHRYDRGDHVPNVWIWTARYALTITGRKLVK